MVDSSDFIEELEAKPLSEDDIRAIAGPSCLVLPYSHLKYVVSIQELFRHHLACVILYKSRVDYGHWVCLTYDPDTGVVSYFDSYGKPVDYWLREQSAADRKKLGQEADYLKALLLRALELRSLNGLHVNNKALQSSDSRVANCGRYAALRALFSHLTNSEFIDMISDSKGYGSATDRNVSLLTALLDS